MAFELMCFLLAGITFSHGIQIVNRDTRRFEIDYTNDQFLKDGEPFRYISGSLHYFRVPRAYWRDRLRKFRAAGLNAVSTYVEWNLHEPTPGEYSFEGENDLEHFIRLAEEEGLLVILRPGPYICAERDFGGFPGWLLTVNPKMKLRTNDSSYTENVFRWLNILFPRIQPLLYGNGGPIIMVQVENEYGSFAASDRNYMQWMANVVRHYVQDKAVLFTTDGASLKSLKSGAIPGVFATVDFGCGEDVTKSFADLRKFQPHGPLVNSEFYPGWITAWGDTKMAATSTKCVVDSTRQLLTHNVSFNYYMFHGGTNFGLSSGSDPPYKPVITSYDYDAPISESGNLTEKYYAIKAIISEFNGVTNYTVDHSEPVDYGTVVLSSRVPLFGSGTEVEYGTFQYPQTFEFLKQYRGFLLYETILPADSIDLRFLATATIHDRTIVFLNKVPIGVLSRMDRKSNMVIGFNGQGEQLLSLLVENQGHINFKNMFDPKGLVSNVSINGKVLTGWKHTGYPLTHKVSNLLASPNVSSTGTSLPAYFSGMFEIKRNASTGSFQDTFVDMTGWGKGVLWVNDFCLGRYWPGKGPQISLYLPGTKLQTHNTLTVLELGKVQPNSSVQLNAKPTFK